MRKDKYCIIILMMAFAVAACGEKRTGKLATKNEAALVVKENSKEVATVHQQVRKMQSRLKINYQQSDSLKVVSLLKEAAKLNKKPQSWMLWFGDKLKGIPYVGGTLDRTEDEELIVNLRELDCTTFVEQVLALSECAGKGYTTFNDFVQQLLHVRYIGGKAEYTKRQHYFTVWINDNAKEGLVEDIQEPNPPFTSVQKIKIDYMTTHQSSYKMLKAHPEWSEGISELENSVNGKSYRFIPKESIVNTKLMRSTVHDGDIIAIITNKKGLDTTHIGIAVWHKDGLHLINASSIHKKVIDEPMLLRTYMRKHPVQIGIRIARPKI